MIKPTIGRIVWFYENKQQEQPLPGIVCYVHSDTLVNLAVFDVNGNPAPKTSVFLFQDEGGYEPVTHFATWMPYQKGQAARTEELEKRLSR